MHVRVCAQCLCDLQPNRLSRLFLPHVLNFGGKIEQMCYIWKTVLIYAQCQCDLQPNRLSQAFLRVWGRGYAYLCSWQYIDHSGGTVSKKCIMWKIQYPLPHCHNSHYLMLISLYACVLWSFIGWGGGIRTGILLFYFQIGFIRLFMQMNVCINK